MALMSNLLNKGEVMKPKTTVHIYIPKALPLNDKYIGDREKMQEVSADMYASSIMKKNRNRRQALEEARELAIIESMFL